MRRQKGGSSGPTLVGFAGAVVILAALFGGWVQQQQAPSQTPTPPAVVATATPSPTPPPCNQLMQWCG